MAPTIPHGIGYMVWQCATLPKPTEDFAKMLSQEYGVEHLCIKTSDGVSNMNQDMGGDKGLREWIDTVRKWVEVIGAWSYIYPKPTHSPGTQAAKSSERIEKFGLDYLWIDAEHDSRVGAEWMTGTYRTMSAKTYMEQLKAGLNLKFPTALCSHRFPKYFPGFPFQHFLNHERSNHVAPQMYAVGAHNPDEQLVRCLQEYSAIRKVDASFPMVPVGCAYGQVINSKLWVPSVQDFHTFAQEAKKQRCPGISFWSLDWVVKNKRWDWMQAVAAAWSGAPQPPPIDPPPPPPPEMDVPNILVITKTLNVRSGPGIGYPIVGELHQDEQHAITEIHGADVWVRLRDKDGWACARKGTSELAKVRFPS